MLYFWGPWCGPCVRTTPRREAVFGELLRMHDDLVVLSLSRDEEEKATREHLAKHEVNSLQALIPFESRITDAYFVRGAGYYFVVDQNGQIAAMRFGLDELRAEVDKLVSPQ